MSLMVLSGRYELERRIGTGGMSEVYLATDLMHDRRVAVKVLRAELGADAEFVRRFNQEADAAKRMSHPNIVRMYDVGQDAGKRYLVMEYVEGRTLKELIRERGRIAPIEAVKMAVRILDAVDHAHKNHIVHRDIKPQNILVTHGNDIKVADFGIARTTDQVTMTGRLDSVFGSVHYFSPEQASGQVADEKSDLYSVGVVLYEMATGRVPFDGESPVSVAYKHINEPPVSARALQPDISPALDEVIQKSLDKSAARRYQTAAEMATDLKRAVRAPQGGFVTYPREQQPAQPARPSRRARLKRHLKLAAIVALLGILAAGGVLGVQLYQRLVNGVTVPSLVLLNEGAAIEKLNELGLRYTIDTRHHDDIPSDVVIEQMPAMGTKAMRGDNVRLTMSLGKEKLMMPKLLDLTRSEAVHQIEELGLVLEGVALQISGAKPGTVIDQRPQANDWVEQGAGVTLTISGESAPMPDLRGLDEEAARIQLLASGFKMGVRVERLSDLAGGTVIEQSIPPEQQTLLGEAVNIVVSQVVPVSYYADVEVSVTVEQDGDEVRVVLDEADGAEREVYRDQPEAGTQQIQLRLDSLEKGEHKLSVYVAGELVVEKAVNFE
ncbi:MAG: protein kinase [Clostridiales bacterium]|nr:protein kinase [Clostridiales bacterium]